MRNRNRRRLIATDLTTAILIPTLLACGHFDPQASNSSEGTPRSQATTQECESHLQNQYSPDPATEERDVIYSLVAFSVVLKDWQTSASHDHKSARGYNIGSVLVDTRKPLDQQLVCWARNSVIRSVDGTRHGEVRLIENFLKKDKHQRKLEGFKIYTSLEPCAMCAGMMTLQSVQTTIYGQSDPRFGKAFERLQLNTSDRRGGFCPYPRAVQTVASSHSSRYALDSAFAASGSESIVEWLTSQTARALFEEARESLESFEVRYPENKKVLASAIRFLSIVPSSFAEIPYNEGCPNGTANN